MSENKTRPGTENVEAFLNAIPDEQKRRDAFELLALMRKVTRTEPVLWGGSMVGFGQYHYKYASGREGDSFLTGFSPRKQNFAIYINAGFDEYGDLLARLGKYSTGRACLYIKRLADVDRRTLEQLVRASYRHMKKAYP